MNIDEIITNALEEDIGEGDHTSLACIGKDVEGKANLIIKEDGILAGVEIAKKIFSKVDKNLVFSASKKEGDIIKKGDKAFSVSGKVHSILKSERLVLNFMQRMSGIATNTSKFAELIKDTKAKILDTRKTTPNLRQIEKLAVKIGGGVNHRSGLYDMIMIKDNHVDFAGGIEKAIRRANDYIEKYKPGLKIEIEVRNIAELRKVMQTGNINIIMLDNFFLADLQEAIKIIDGKYITEASGGINHETILQIAQTGVDYISIGALTHQINSLDMSLKAIH